MDLLPGYASSDSDSGKHQKDIQVSHQEAPKAKLPDRRILQAAPTPSILASVKANHALDKIHGNSTARSLQTSHTKSNNGGSGKGAAAGEMVLMNNPLKSQLMQPVQGPAILDPNGIQIVKKKRGDESHIKANVTFDHASFEEQRNAFQRTGQARAPDERGSFVDREI